MQKMKEIISRLNQWARSKAFIYYPVHCVHWILVNLVMWSDWELHKLFTSFNHDGLNTTEHRDKKIIVSLTSYPARINIVPYVIASILKQTMKPDKIILWLGIEKFPDKKLPKIFEKLKRCGVDIEFREDLGPHTKYFYAMKEYPEDLIITLDDDWVYDNNVIERLYGSYIKRPDYVHAVRIEEIKLTPDGSIASYDDFDLTGGIIGHASHCYMASGVSGVLYPPHSINEEVFNLEAMKKLCPKADDIWLRIMEMLNDTRTVLAAHINVPGTGIPGFMIYGSQKMALWRSNVNDRENDSQMKAVIDAYNTWPSNGKTLIEMMREDSNGVE